MLAFRCVPLVAVVPLLVNAPTTLGQDQAEVRAGIEKGLEYLRRQQFDDGTWDFKNHTVGITALVGLTLAENRVPLSDPDLRRAYYYVRENCERETQTYDVALSILFLSRAGDRRDRSRVRSLARSLMEGQLDSGGWTYRLRKGGSGPGDNSNTQFAVLGLWVASRAGAKVEQALDRVEERFRSTQVKSGGWGYRPDQGSGSYSMSFAGLFALAVAEADDIRRQQQEADVPSAGKAGADAPDAVEAVPEQAPRQSLMADPAFRKGFERVGVLFGRPIDPKRPSPVQLPYYLWSVERLGVLLGVSEFGETDWYAKGSAALLECQLENGSWNWEERVAGGPIANTCFALLFLRRANLGSDITRLLEGDPEKPFVIVGRPGEVATRFKTLKKAVAGAKDGEIIDVEGPGPYEPEHQVFDKSLTLRAAKGYEPIFRYTRGRNRFGVARDPERDPEARHMFNVRGATLVLEGLRLRMDPGLIFEQWTGMVGVSDGSLRALNCMFSQSNRHGAAGVVAEGQSDVLLQNCMCVGLEAAVQLAAEEQRAVTLENCVLFGGVAVEVRSAGEAKEPAVKIVLRNNTIHADELLRVEAMSGDVAVMADGNAMRLNWVCSSLDPLQGGGRRTWRGGEGDSGAANLYDVRRWLGRRGRPMREVRNLETWRQFWKTDEAGSVQEPVPFATARQLGAFRHDLSAMDWRVVDGRLTKSAEFGADTFLVGVGSPYGAYREQSEAVVETGDAP